MTPEQETLARQYAADESVVSTDRALLRVVLAALDEREAQRAQAQHETTLANGRAEKSERDALIAVAERNELASAIDVGTEGETPATVLARRIVKTQATADVYRQERDAARKTALKEAHAVCLAQAVGRWGWERAASRCAEAIGELIPYEEAEK